MTRHCHKNLMGFTSNAFKSHQRLFTVVQHPKLECPCHAQMGSAHHLQAGNPKSKPSAPYKSVSPSTWAIFGGGRDSGLPFLCPPCTEGWGSQFFPHASPCGLAAAELQIAEGRVNSESGKLQGTSCKRHLHNPNEPEMSSRGKKKNPPRNHVNCSPFPSISFPPFKSRNERSEIPGKPEKTGVPQQPELGMQAGLTRQPLLCFSTHLIFPQAHF